MAAALNVRQAPSTATSVVGLLRQDDVFQASAASDDGRWVLFVRDGVPGWVSMKHLQPLPDLPPGDADYPWLGVAAGEGGVGSLPGRENNLRVLEYLRSTDNLGALATSRDETSWCSAFVNWCLKRAGHEGTGSALALSWLRWGGRHAKRGCIVTSRGPVVWPRWIFRRTWIWLVPAATNATPRQDVMK
jgi:hypothetical protein